LTDPDFISEQAILALHEDLLAAFGGPSGWNAALVDSIAAYPLQKYAYLVPPPDVQELAAYYAFAAAKFHAFTDGNKRVSLALMELFLMLNGFELLSPDEENEEIILALARGDISEDEMVAWVRDNSAPMV
jgi:death on curing protein